MSLDLSLKCECTCFHKILIDPERNSLFIILRNPQGQKVFHTWGVKVSHRVQAASALSLKSHQKREQCCPRQQMSGRKFSLYLPIDPILCPPPVYKAKLKSSSRFSHISVTWNGIHFDQHPCKYTESLKLIFGSITWLQGFYSQTLEKLGLMLPTFKSLFQHTLIILLQFDSLFPESHIDKLSRDMAVYTISFYAQARNKITDSRMHQYHKGHAQK